MSTLYIREVPDDVVTTLKLRAAAEGSSLSSYVGRELARIAGRPINEEVVARLKARDRSNGSTSDQIVIEVRSGRR